MDFFTWCAALIIGMCIGLCASRTVHMDAVQKGITACGINQGINSINTSSFGAYIEVKCVNGAVFEIPNNSVRKD